MARATLWRQKHVSLFLSPPNKVANTVSLCGIRQVCRSHLGRSLRTTREPSERHPFGRTMPVRQEAPQTSQHSGRRNLAKHPVIEPLHFVETQASSSRNLARFLFCKLVSTHYRSAAEVQNWHQISSYSWPPRGTIGISLALAAAPTPNSLWRANKAYMILSTSSAGGGWDMGLNAISFPRTACRLHSMMLQFRQPWCVAKRSVGTLFQAPERQKPRLDLRERQ